MAALFFRLRRALTLSSPLLKDGHFSSLSPSPPPPLAPPKLYSPLVGNPSSRPPHFLIQAHSFRSSAALTGRFDQNEKEIGPDEILFEGCDYNHWLITIDFPKDPENAPLREEMIETYVQTAAKVFGSVEEAKKRIYACSTTTYHGFQCVMDEATSEKFRGLPGVVFILPDSYIDPVNKEYGGDKYENGVITPRPPPVQYGRGRYNDRNRNYDQRRPRQYGDRNMNYNQQGSAPQDGRGFGPPPQDGRGYGPPQQDGRGYGPPQQDGRGYGPPQQGGRGYGPPQQDGMGYGQGQRNFSQGQGGDYRPGSAADYRQNSGLGFAGEPRQGPGAGFSGNNGQGTESGYAGDYRQGSDFSHGSSSS